MIPMKINYIHKRAKYIIMKWPIILLIFTIVAAYQVAKINGQTADRQDQSVNRNMDGLGRFMSVNIPMFYDMVRNGSSMGMNVLSGLVKIERGDEAEKNGLMGNGRRPLSVRIFGVPVFERGVRVRPPNDVSRPKEVDGEEEDASIEPLAD